MVEIQRRAAHIVSQVLSGRSLDAELRSVAAAQPDLPGPDRAALQDVVYGTLRFLGQIDAVLTGLLTRPLKDDGVRDLLRVALYQLIGTRAAAHAVVDHAVRTCVALGKPAAKGLVNGVLRNFLRNREAALSVADETEVGRYSYPQWWIDKLRTQYPKHYREMLEAGNRHPPLTVRVNRRRASVAHYLARLKEAGIDARALGGDAIIFERPAPVDQIPGFREGEVSVQDAAAQYAATVLDATPGMRVLDACAAPGGKSAHILECVDVELTALDHDQARLARIASNLKRLNLHAQLICGDAAVAAPWWDGRTYARILADVPCSASGVVRRHPDIKWLRRARDIEGFANRQRAILDALWQLLGSDGKLVYATCSVFREENDEQMEHFLARHRDARRLTLPAPHTQAQQIAGQILPDERHDGFFYALLQKS